MKYESDGHPELQPDSRGDAGYDDSVYEHGGLFEEMDRDSITGRDPLISDYSNQSLLVAKAAELMVASTKEMKKACLLEDVVFERLTASRRDSEGAILEGSVGFALKARGGLPPKRTKIFITVAISGGFLFPPCSFEDSSGRSFPLSREGIKEHVGASYTDPPLILKRFPNAQLSITDRTILPSTPARSFFSVAQRTAKWDDLSSTGWDEPEKKEPEKKKPDLREFEHPGLKQSKEWTKTDPDIPFILTGQIEDEAVLIKNDVPGGKILPDESFDWSDD